MASSVSCEADKAAEKKSVEPTAASEGADKKQEKRGIWGEGYGHFGGGGGGGGGDWGHHGWEEDHQHVHHHHEKTIVNVKKIAAPYPVEKQVSFTVPRIL